MNVCVVVCRVSGAYVTDDTILLLLECFLFADVLCLVCYGDLAFGDKVT